MAKIVSEYRFVFVDESQLGKDAKVIESGKAHGMGKDSGMTGLAATRALTIKERAQQGERIRMKGAVLDFQEEYGREPKTAREFNRYMKTGYKDIEPRKLYAGTIAAIGAANRILDTAMNISTMKKVSSATRGGDLVAAEYATIKKQRHDQAVSQVMSLAKYATMGAMIGSAFTPIGTGIGAGIGMGLDVILRGAQRGAEYQESLRNFNHDMQLQKYKGALTAQRLVNIQGRPR